MRGLPKLDLVGELSNVTFCSEKEVCESKTNADADPAFTVVELSSDRKNIEMIHIENLTI
jgi:hypothetical protein